MKDKERTALEWLRLKPPGPESYEMRIGNTQRSDYEFLQGLRESEAVKSRLDAASTAGDMLDVTDSTLKMMGDKHRDNSEINSRYLGIPSSDYSDPYPAPEENFNETTQNQHHMTDKDKFKENEEDITSPEEEKTSDTLKEDLTNEPAEEITDEQDGDASKMDEFKENKNEITGEGEEPSRMEDFYENKDDMDIPGINDSVSDKFTENRLDTDTFPFDEPVDSASDNTDDDTGASNDSEDDDDDDSNDH